MLINTVVIFLRELMPVLLLVSLLLVWQRQQAPLLLGWIMVPASVGLVLLSQQYGQISLWLDGAGIELLYAIFYAAVPILLALAIMLRAWQTQFAGLAAAALFIINGSNLVLYLFVYPRDMHESPLLLLGAALGIGIGLSVAIILYYAMDELKRLRPWLYGVMLCLIAARQSSEASQILIQADWLAGGALLWDSQHLISEQSEYGHFLNALVGYEATPSSSQMVVYLVTVLILAALCWRQGEFR